MTTQKSQYDSAGNNTARHIYCCRHKCISGANSPVWRQRCRLKSIFHRPFVAATSVSVQFIIEPRSVVIIWSIIYRRPTDRHSLPPRVARSTNGVVNRQSRMARDGCGRGHCAPLGVKSGPSGEGGTETLFKN